MLSELKRIKNLELKKHQTRDFFKLVNHPIVDYEQSDQVMKRFYGKQIENILTASQSTKQSSNRSKSTYPIKQKIAKLNLYQQQEFGKLKTDFQEYVAGQSIIEENIMKQRYEELKNLKYFYINDFKEATQIKPQDQQVNLFKTILETEKSQVKVHNQQVVLQNKNSVLTPLMKLKGKKQSIDTPYLQQGQMTSSQHLLSINQTSQIKQVNVSEIYIPKEKREFKLQLQKKQNMNKKKSNFIDKKQVQFDIDLLTEQINEYNHELLESPRKRKKQKMESTEKKVNQRMRLSFSDGLIKYDDVKYLSNPLREKKKSLTLRDVKIIKNMIKAQRYPIAEYLLHCPESYDLYIDSLIKQGYNSDDQREQAKYRQPLNAPNNSLDSLEEIDFKSSSESATDMIPQPQNRKEKQELKKKAIKVNKDSLDLHGFDNDELQAYPHQYTEKEIPFVVLKSNLKKNIKEMETIIAKRLQHEFQEKVYFPTFEHIQMAFEQYCLDFNAQHFKLDVYFKKGQLIFRNQTLPANLLKALCITIPLLGGCKCVSFENNNLMDEFGPLLLFAIFMNPDIQIFKIKNNFMRSTFVQTYQFLMQKFPSKLVEVAIINSISVSDHLDYITFDNHLFKKLKILNLSNNVLSPASCRNIGAYLINSEILKNLDISGCKLQNQSTRSIIDGLNRNNGLQYFNFSSNFLSSSIYEFSIKMAKILTRHSQIMHVDLSCTGLRKEEVLFLGMSISSSKSCLGLHLSANNLDYYERIFLRTLANAQVSYHFRNMAQEIGSIRSQKERFQIQELKNHDYDNEELQQFVQKWNYIDQQRLGLDEEINKILKDLDITEIFRQLKKGNKSSADSSMLLQDLIKKIEQRKEELANMKETEEDFFDNQQQMHFDLDDVGTLNNFKQMGLYNIDQEGKVTQKAKRDLKEGDNEGEDFWIMQNALKIDRIKKRIEVDVDRQKRAKSAGEMALKFMGINKIAYELLLENPMTGYMNDIVISRILGNDDIMNSTGWKDSSQCYICEKWDKTKIEYFDNDQQIMKQNTNKLDDLYYVLQQCVDLTNKKLIKKVPQSQIQKMFQEDNEDVFGTNRFKNESPIEERSIATPLSDKIYTESIDSQMSNYDLKDIDIGNNISAIKIDKQRLAKNLPRNHSVARKIQQNNKKLEISSESDIEEYNNLLKTPKQAIIQTNEPNNNKRQDDYDNQSVESNQFIEQSKEPEKKKLTEKQFEKELEIQPGKKTKLVKRTIFFQGAAFVVEEEISVDSDEEISVLTSEDEFSVDDEGVKDNYKDRLRQQQENPKLSKNQIKNDENLLKNLNKNRPLQLYNVFGRKQVYLVASFNDWIPIEMHTIYEIKIKEQRKKDLQGWIEKQEGKIKSKKREENIVQYTNYLPTGKHFFYYIYQNKHLFLSPKYDIVRFKGSNVFLNTITVKARTKELVQVTLGRNVYTTEQIKFNKERSVFKDFQEDTPEFLMKMLEQDLLYSKIGRLTKTPEDQEILKQLIYKNYLKVKNIFLALASNSSYPTLGQNDTTEFVRRSGLFGKNLNLARMDQQMIATNVSTNKYKQNAERELHRYEFVEFIVRLALTIYKEPKKTDTLWDATQMILEKDIYPKNQSVDGLAFREEFMYNLKVDEIFKRNLAVIQKLFESFLTPAKKFVTLEECTKLIRKAGLNISELRINPCYAESMMSRIDTMTDQSALLQMKFVEFLVFISRVAHEVYQNTKQEGLLLHLKIDKILTPVLDTEGLSKIFSYNQEESDKESEQHSGQSEKQYGSDNEDKNSDNGKIQQDEQQQD